MKNVDKKWGNVINYMVNKEEDKAKELFSEIVIEKCKKN